MSLFKHKIKSVIFLSLALAGVIFIIISIVQAINGSHENPLMSLIMGIMCLLIPILDFEINK
jgi:hypothetical protein